MIYHEQNSFWEVISETKGERSSGVSHKDLGTNQNIHTHTYLQKQTLLDNFKEFIIKFKCISNLVYLQHDSQSDLQSDIQYPYLTMISV